ncbi:MAG: hypothetical protein WBY93_10860, partial [Candidatus Binatus sp.]
TFNSPVKVPLHQSTDVDCVSHGIQESNLLREVLVEAKQTHRPEYAKPATSPPGASTITAESPSPARRTPSSIDKAPATRSMPPRRGFSLSGPLTLPDLPAPPQ